VKENTKNITIPKVLKIAAQLAEFHCEISELIVIENPGSENCTCYGVCCRCSRHILFKFP